MSQRRAAITAVGTYVPERLLTNADLERMVETSDEWIRTRTGISTRHVVEPGTPTSEIAAKAATDALRRRGIGPEELDLVIVATVTPDMPFPATACLVQDRIGARKAWGFDLAAACSGFVYALNVADNAMRAGDYSRVLLVGTDALSTMVDWNDRAVSVLFGDGAGAAVMVSEPGPRGVLASLLRSSGEYWHLLSVRSTGVRATLDSEVRRSPDDAIKMKGPELFKLAVRSMADVTLKVAERAGVRLDDVALIVPHQANIRILNAVADRLGVSHDKVFTNIDRYGNTSAASVPIALDEAVEANRIHDNDLVMLNACGGGLTWGANLLRW